MKILSFNRQLQLNYLLLYSPALKYLKKVMWLKFNYLGTLQVHILLVKLNCVCFRGWRLKWYWTSKLITNLLHFQGSHIKIKTNTEIPVQVDGEPWLQPPGDIVVLRSALKVNPVQISKFSSTHKMHILGMAICNTSLQRHRWPRTEMHANSNTIFCTVINALSHGGIRFVQSPHLL